MNLSSVGADPNARQRWLHLSAGSAAAALAALFLIEAVGACLGLSRAPVNWLILLFQENTPAAAGLSALNVLRPGDLLLMFLFGLLMAGLYPQLRRASKAWAAVTVALPFLGIVVFLITAMAGRSAVLLAGLISAILVQRSGLIVGRMASTGWIAGALLLFAGDFGTAALPPSPVIAILIAIGYALWVAWLAEVAVALYRQARAPSPREAIAR